MSVADLKSIMHHRIDQLHDEETVLDLFATMNSFLENRSVPLDTNAPEIVARLEQALAQQRSGQRGISSDELLEKCSNGVHADLVNRCTGGYPYPY